MHNPFTRNSLSSLISGPIIWSVHFLVCYVGVSLVCAFGFGHINAVIALATVIAAALLAYAGFANHQKWNEARRTHSPGADPDADTRAFFALNAMMLCTLSAIALAWVAFPAAVLPTCAA